jgi:hypothetical protein
VIDDTGARVARLANQRKVADAATILQQQRARELKQAVREANMSYFVGMLNRQIANFNRTADPDLLLSIKVDEIKLYFVRSFTNLLVVQVEEEMVRVQTPAVSARMIERRFAITHSDGLQPMTLVEVLVEDAQPLKADAFCESLMKLALGLPA